MTFKHLVNNILAKHIHLDETIDKSTNRIFPKIDINESLGLASRMLEKDQYIIVTETIGQFLLYFKNIFTTISLF